MAAHTHTLHAGEILAIQRFSREGTGAGDFLLVLRVERRLLCLISHQIFSTVKGFYVQYTESLCDACVAAWNVQVLRFRHKTVKLYHGALDIKTS